MKKWFFSAFLMMLILPAFMQAQKTVTEGYVKYEITDVKADDPQMEAALGMMKGSTMEIFFTGKKQSMVMDMMGGMMKMTTINLVDEKEAIMLMDMMGRKIKVKGTEEEFKAMGQQEGVEDVKYDIVYDKTKTKTIAGYPCYQATIKMAQMGEDMSIVTYVTDKLQAPKSVIRNVESLEINGLPLEYTVGAQGFAMTYTASVVETKVNAEDFAIPDGYEEMTIEEFMKTMGAMGGGMGF